jgi:hypothetical protein
MLPEDVDYATAERKMMAPNVAVLFVGDETPGGSVAKRHPERFEPQFRCDTGDAPCTVYLRR